MQLGCKKFVRRNKIKLFIIKLVTRIAVGFFMFLKWVGVHAILNRVMEKPVSNIPSELDAREAKQEGRSGKRSGKEKRWCY